MQGQVLKGRIALPNVDGRIDHFSADVKGQRLFLSALGNHTVEVLDVQSGKRVHTIPDLAEPQGLYYDPSSNRLFVACASDGAAKVFDGRTFQLLWRRRADVFEQKDPDRCDRIAHQPTSPGARTGLFVPDWRKLFVAVPHRGEQRAGVLVYDVQ